MADEFKSEKPAKIRKYATGERHGRHLLTAAQVVEIRHRYATTRDTLSAIAWTYGVSLTTISQIVRGNTWKSLLPPPPEA